MSKLCLLLLLIPLFFNLIKFMKRKNKGNDEAQNKVDFPWFLVGFILMSVLGSYVFAHSIPMSKGVMDGISTATTWILTAAKVGLGLNVSLQDVRTRAMKPLLAMTITSVCLSILAFFII